MKPKLTFFYNDECGKCADLKPIINEFSQHLPITLVNTYEDDLLTESTQSTVGTYVSNRRPKRKT
jgi:thiol-disulfide isomerase/thioredoxin